jgi:ribosomal protein S18 acetylase RimI-like enzyme
MSPVQRFVLAAPVRCFEVTADAQTRPVMPQDLHAVSELIHSAYRGTIDDEGETPADTLALVRQLFEGEFGPVLWSASELTLRGGALASVVMLTLWMDGPFVAFAATAPAFQRQGLARAGLQRAFNRMAAGDEPWLRLLVTQGNTRAEDLYASLGFRPLPQPPFTTA